MLTEVCKRVGVDPTKFFAGISEQAIKDQLKANTDEVMARGGFGSPTIFIDKTDMYFGNDRLPLVREALARRKASARLMPKAVVCRELGPPERLRLETFAVCAAGAGAGARRHSRRRDQFSRHPDGGRRVSAQAGVAVHAGRGGRRRRDRGRWRGSGVAVGDKVIVKMRHGAYADEAVVTPSQLDAAAVDFRLCRGRDVSRRARHGVSRADRSRAASVRRSAAGAWRRRRRRACRGRDRQDARRHRDRGGVIGGKARGGAGEGRRSSGAVRARAVPRRGQAHHRRPRRRRGVRSRRRRDLREQPALHRLGRARCW